jgi:hypothetical protein
MEQVQLNPTLLTSMQLSSFVLDHIVVKAISVENLSFKLALVKMDVTHSFMGCLDSRAKN